MRLNHLISILGMALALALAVSGCTPQGAEEAGRSLAPAVDTDTVVFNMGSAPRHIDPAQTISVVGFNVAQHVFEGLTEIGAGETVHPGVAERWEMSEDGLTYDFFLREDARWSDGQPVVAGDFVYAWTRVLRPSTGAAYANLLFGIENGEAFHRGEIEDPDLLGIEAINDRHLRVRLSRPVSFFLQLTSFATLMPVREDIVEANPEGWSHSAETYLGNGAFRMAEWEPGHRFVFERSETYWNRAQVSLERLIWLQITDAQSELTAYLSNQLDVSDTVPYPDVPWIREEMPEHLILDNLAGTYFVYFNLEVPLLQDVRIRRALSLAVDRETLTSEVTEGLNRAASGWVPAGIPDAQEGREFCGVSGELVPIAGSPEEARRLLAEAGYPGGEGFPPLSYTYNTLDVNRRVAERLQSTWRRELSIEVNLINQEWQVLISSLRDGNYELGRFAWIADYGDPMTFLDIWMSEDGNNRGRYRDPAYDALVREAMQTSDRQAYFDLCHRAEHMLIDDMVLIPIWFTRSAWLSNPALEGVLHTPTGDMLFHRARWNTERLAGDSGAASP